MFTSAGVYCGFKGVFWEGDRSNRDSLTVSSDSRIVAASLHSSYHLCQLTLWSVFQFAVAATSVNFVVVPVKNELKTTLEVSTQLIATCLPASVPVHSKRVQQNHILILTHSLYVFYTILPMAICSCKRIGPIEFSVISSFSWPDWNFIVILIVIVIFMVIFIVIFYTAFGGMRAMVTVDFA